MWSNDEVRSLEYYQRYGQFHPFTCDNGCGDLIPTKDGWVCKLCSYTQDWAHEFMLNWDWLKNCNPVFLPEEAKKEYYARGFEREKFSYTNLLDY